LIPTKFCLVVGTKSTHHELCTGVKSAMYDLLVYRAWLGDNCERQRVVDAVGWWHDNSRVKSSQV